MATGMSRKPDDFDSRIERFRSFTVAHPRLVEAKETLVNAIRGAEPNSLIFVFGPTGVGKTTLRLKTEQSITTEMFSELREDHTRIPVVSVEAVAPESGSFNWRDHYKRLLHQLDEPLIDHKLGRQSGWVVCRPRYALHANPTCRRYRVPIRRGAGCPLSQTRRGDDR